VAAGVVREVVLEREDELTFVPDPLPRRGRFAVWQAGRGAPRDVNGSLTVVVPGPTQARRREVACRWLPVGEAVDLLLDARAAELSASAAAWRLVVTDALALLARGRLLPTVTDDGADAWRVGPLDVADEARRAAVAAALPTTAFAAVLGSRSQPATVAAPAPLIASAADAVADAFVRTAAAADACGFEAFAGEGPTDVAGLRPWLAEATAPPSAALRPVLRIELPLDLGTRDDETAGEGDDAAEGPARPGDPFVAVLQARSQVDWSLVVDAADLWHAAGAVRQRFGSDADAQLLLAVRRGARAWPPLARFLDERSPDRLELADGEVEQLLGASAEALAAAGFEVLWPAELTGGLTVKAKTASVTTAPSGSVGPGVGLDQLVTFDWQVALGDTTLTAAEVAALAEAKRPLLRLRGKWVLVDPEMLDKLRRPPRRATASEVLAAALSGEVVVEGEALPLEVEGPLASLAERLRHLDGTRDMAEPEGLDAVLRPYQRRGLAWLTEIAGLGVGGCLADDMGLGKTVQLLGLHVHRSLDPATRAPTLVVCPASLVGNWERETNRFSPGVPTRRYHGADRHLVDVADDELVIVTYGTLRRDREALAEISWGLVVADEAQHVKNPMGQTARELRKVPAAARIAMTGTPVENRLSELWALLDWTTPGLLGPLERFRTHVAGPIERGQDPEAAERLATLVRPFLLRRRKTDPGIAPDLPPKTTTDHVISLTAEQVTLYEAATREHLARISDARGMARRGLVLALLTALKQVCNHPAQLLGQPGPIAGRSGKLAAVDELIDAIVDAGDQVLVFSQYVQMGKLLERHMAARGLPTAFLHGSVPVRARDDMVARFQSGAVPVFLLSLKAGGTGLNLTAATHVIHYDRWWNPAVEDQASDRAWRIGQDRPVQIHRMTSRGTLEERIAAVLEAKRGLADAVLSGGEAWLTELDDDALAELVTFGAEP
jgi:superfamily II DNA or RNA helicase